MKLLEGDTYRETTAGRIADLRLDIHTFLSKEWYKRFRPTSDYFADVKSSLRQPIAVETNVFTDMESDRAIESAFRQNKTQSYETC